MIPSVVFERYRRSLSPDGACLLSSYSTGSHGYTQIGWSESGQATMVLGHRVAWEMHFGPIPDGMTIDHICRNRRCGRIDHLRLMTNEENARMNGNAIKTRCKRGHPFDEANTYVDGRGHRRCRSCARERRF